MHGITLYQIQWDFGISPITLNSGFGIWNFKAPIPIWILSEFLFRLFQQKTQSVRRLKLYPQHSTLIQHPTYPTLDIQEPKPERDSITLQSTVLQFYSKK